MSMFDSVFVECFACGEEVEFQSKAGSCLGIQHALDCVPVAIAEDLSNETEVCSCGEKITLYNPHAQHVVAMMVKKTSDKTMKKIVRTKNTLTLLENACICFESKNGGKHLIVEGAECMIDFWPSTGKWHCRSGKKGFGASNLIKYIKLK